MSLGAGGRGLGCGSTKSGGPHLRSVVGSAPLVAVLHICRSSSVMNNWIDGAAYLDTSLGGRRGEEAGVVGRPCDAGHRPVGLAYAMEWMFGVLCNLRIARWEKQLGCCAKHEKRQKSGHRVRHYHRTCLCGQWEVLWEAATCGGKVGPQMSGSGGQLPAAPASTRGLASRTIKVPSA